MRLIISTFQDEDGVYIAECLNIPGCVSQGATESKALENVKQAIKECLEVRVEKGMPLTVSTHQIEIDLNGYIL